MRSGKAIFEEVFRVAGSPSDPRPIYVNHEAMADIREWGREHIEVITDIHALRRGLCLTIFGWQIYLLENVPEGHLFIPPSSWAPAWGTILDTWLYPKTPKTRWERLLADDPFV